MKSLFLAHFYIEENIFQYNKSDLFEVKDNEVVKIKLKS